MTARASLPAAKAPRRAAVAFDDQLLFTHRGLSGPAILQISSYWRPGEELTLDLHSGDTAQALRQAKREGGRVQVATVLARLLPERLATAIVAEEGLEGARLADQPDARLDALARRYEVPLKALRQRNALAAGSVLRPGMVLVIDAPLAAP